MEFNIGDYIIMKSGAPYGYTQASSTGVVEYVSDTHVRVRFDYMSGDTYIGDDPTFSIQKIHCELFKQIPQEEQILRKIKLMESRWVAFQARKQEWNCHV